MSSLYSLKTFLSEQPERWNLFVVELHTRRHHWLTLIVDGADPEQIELVRFDSGRRSWDIWSKFPAKGQMPQEAFGEPLAHHDYRFRSYKLDVTVEKNTELVVSAEIALEIRHLGEHVLLLELDPNLRVTEVKTAMAL